MEEGGVKDPRPGVEAEWIHAFDEKISSGVDNKQLRPRS